MMAMVECWKDGVDGTRASVSVVVVAAAVKVVPMLLL